MKGMDLFFLQPLYQQLVDRPALLRQLEREYGLRPVSQQGLGLMATSALLRLLERLHAEGDPHRGALLAVQADASVASGMLYYLRSHALLGESMAELLRLRARFLPDGHMRMDVQAHQVAIHMRPAYQSQRLGRQLRYEAGLVWLHHVFTQCAGGHLASLSVELMSPPSTQPGVLDALLGCPIQWGREACVIRYPRSALTLALPGYSPGVLSALRPQVDSLLPGPSAAQARASEKVAAWLAAQPHLSQVTVEQAAQAMACGASTLRRQLMNEGQGFNVLLQAQRRARAFAAVAFGEQPLGQVAVALGYSDRAGLERAFHNWFALRPALMRAELKSLLAPLGLEASAALRQSVFEAIASNADDGQSRVDNVTSVQRRSWMRVTLVQAILAGSEVALEPAHEFLCSAVSLGWLWVQALPGEAQASSPASPMDPLTRMDCARALQAARLLLAAWQASPDCLQRLQRLQEDVQAGRAEPWADALVWADELVSALLPDAPSASLSPAAQRCLQALRQVGHAWADAAAWQAHCEALGQQALQQVERVCPALRLFDAGLVEAALHG